LKHDFAHGGGSSGAQREDKFLAVFSRTTTTGTPEQVSLMRVDGVVSSSAIILSLDSSTHGTDASWQP
jgi:hypothetical protein